MGTDFFNIAGIFKTNTDLLQENNTGDSSRPVAGKTGR